MAKTITYSGDMIFDNSLKVGKYELPQAVIDVADETKKLAGISSQSMISIIDAFTAVNNNICLQLNQYKKNTEESAESKAETGIGNATQVLINFLNGTYVWNITALIEDLVEAITSTKTAIDNVTGEDEETKTTIKAYMDQIEQIDTSIAELYDSAQKYDYTATELEKLTNKLLSALGDFTVERVPLVVSRYDFSSWVNGAKTNGSMIIGGSTVSFDGGVLNNANIDLAGSTVISSLDSRITTVGNDMPTCDNDIITFKNGVTFTHQDISGKQDLITDTSKLSFDLVNHTALDTTISGMQSDIGNKLDAGSFTARFGTELDTAMASSGTIGVALGAKLDAGSFTTRFGSELNTAMSSSGTIGIALAGKQSVITASNPLAYELTTHQDISGKQDKITATSKLSFDLVNHATLDTTISGMQSSISDKLDAGSFTTRFGSELNTAMASSGTLGIAFGSKQDVITASNPLAYDLTTHQDLTGYATKTFVTDKGYQDSDGVNSILSTKGYATESFVTGKGYQTEDNVGTIFNNKLTTEMGATGTIGLALGSKLDAGSFTTRFGDELTTAMGSTGTLGIEFGKKVDSTTYDNDKSDTGAIGSRFKDLGSSVSLIHSNVTNLGSSVTALNNDMPTCNNDIITFKNGVTFTHQDISGKLDSSAYSADLEDSGAIGSRFVNVNTKIANNSSSISSVSSKVTTAQTKANSAYTLAQGKSKTTYSATAPESPAEGDCWFCTSDTEVTGKKIGTTHPTSLTTGTEYGVKITDGQDLSSLISGGAYMNIEGYTIIDSGTLSGDSTLGDSGYANVFGQIGDYGHFGLGLGSDDTNTYGFDIAYGLSGGTANSDFSAVLVYGDGYNDDDILGILYDIVTYSYSPKSLYQYDGSDWVDISTEIVAQKVNATYINTLGLTVVDTDNKPLFEASGSGKYVNAAGFNFKADSMQYGELLWYKGTLKPKLTEANTYDYMSVKLTATEAVPDFVIYVRASYAIGTYTIQTMPRMYISVVNGDLPTWGDAAAMMRLAAKGTNGDIWKYYAYDFGALAAGDYIYIRMAMPKTSAYSCAAGFVINSAYNMAVSYPVKAESDGAFTRYTGQDINQISITNSGIELIGGTEGTISDTTIDGDGIDAEIITGPTSWTTSSKTLATDGFGYYVRNYKSRGYDSYGNANGMACGYASVPAASSVTLYTSTCDTVSSATDSGSGIQVTNVQLTLHNNGTLTLLPLQTNYTVSASTFSVYNPNSTAAYFDWLAFGKIS